MTNEELQKLDRYEISHEEIERLFPKMNNGRKWHVDPKSSQFVDAVIDEWFERQGIDFWSKPEVMQWELVGEPPMIVFYCIPKK